MRLHQNHHYLNSFWNARLINPTTYQCVCFHTNSLSYNAPWIHKSVFRIFIFVSDYQLVSFFRGMRTRYGKIAAKKSGQGFSELSDRDKVIFDTFVFLDNHIKRCPSRQSTKVNILWWFDRNLFCLNLLLGFTHSFPCSSNSDILIKLI